MSSETEIQDVSGVTTQEKVEKFEPSSAWPSRAAEGASLDPASTQTEGTGDLREFFEDGFGGTGPYERPAIAVVGVDVAFDRVLQIVDGMEGPRRRRKDTDGLSHTHRIAHLPTSVNHPTVSVH